MVISAAAESGQSVVFLLTTLSKTNAMMNDTSFPLNIRFENNSNKGRGDEAVMPTREAKHSQLAAYRYVGYGPGLISETGVPSSLDGGFSQLHIRDLLRGISLQGSTAIYVNSALKERMDIHPTDVELWRKMPPVVRSSAPNIHLVPSLATRAKKQIASPAHPPRLSKTIPVTKITKSIAEGVLDPMHLFQQCYEKIHINFCGMSRRLLYFLVLLEVTEGMAHRINE